MKSINLKSRKAISILLALIMTLCVFTALPMSASSLDEETTDTTTDSAAWASESIGYEIFVRSFYDSDGDGIGDFNGIAQKVDYLKELNVGFVWLMPIMESTTYHGYDVVDYYSVNPDYGTMEDFESMVQTLHDNGIRVVIDYVANHTSSSNEWFTTALADSTSKYRDYYFISEEAKSGSGWRYNDEYNLYYYGLYDSIMPDLNYNNQDVRDEMKEVAGYWLEKGVDGFRLDGSCNIDDDSSVTHSWWQEFTSYVKAINPSAYIVGENWLSTMSDISAYYADMDSSFNFPYQSAVEQLAGGTFTDIIDMLNTGHEEYKSASASTDVIKECIDTVMIGNHDMDRIASKLGSTEKAKLAAALEMTLPGTPFIYYGDELGQLGETLDDNRREPMDWYASATGEGMTQMTDFWFNPSKFTIANDGISYEEETDDEDSILNYYRKLTALRTENPIFYTGDYSDVGINDGLFSYIVSDSDTEQKLMVIHNISGTAQTVTLEADATELISDNAVLTGATQEISAYGTVVLSFVGDTLPYTNAYNPPAEAETKDYTLTFEVTLPENTPTDENIYITGSFNSWNECDENYIMERVDDTHCRITITVSGKDGTSLEYKFTRGSWDLREQNSAGQDLIGDEQKQNRYYYFTDVTEDTIYPVIEKWSDIELEPTESTDSTDSTDVTQATDPTSSTDATEPSESSSASISKTSVTLKAGAAKTLKVTNGTAESWNSSKKKVAKVSANGKVTALTKGTTTITANLTDGTTLSCKVRVSSNPKLKKNSITVKKGKTKTVKIVGKASNVKNVYKNTKIAKITSKKTTAKLKIKGLKVGKTTLKVKVNGKKLKLKVKVK